MTASPALVVEVIFVLIVGRDLAGIVGLVLAIPGWPGSGAARERDAYADRGHA